uniref:Uncharacterized protein n=1 Tax=Ananas comosus var. bracteatus TaxID=296719 RepID=A0A6V7P619_ANACO|nr:unnamed protein product [Ananas comosus var. bracteatus]
MGLQGRLNYHLWSSTCQNNASACFQNSLDPNCYVVIIDPTNSIFWYCHSRENKWVKNKCPISKINLDSIALMKSNIYHYDFCNENLVIFEFVPSLNVTKVSSRPLYETTLFIGISRGVVFRKLHLFLNSDDKYLQIFDMEEWVVG